MNCNRPKTGLVRGLPATSAPTLRNNGPLLDGNSFRKAADSFCKTMVFIEAMNCEIEIKTSPRTLREHGSQDHFAKRLFHGQGNTEASCLATVLRLNVDWSDCFWTAEISASPQMSRPCVRADVPAADD
jgi:hypothetical protein